MAGGSERGDSSQTRRERSREAARSRRDKESEMFDLLARELPLPRSLTTSLDKATVLRLTISFLHLRRLLLTGDVDPAPNQQPGLIPQLMPALGGFFLLLGPAGQVVFATHNVQSHLGLSQCEMMGRSIFDFTHPCDHVELQEALQSGPDGNNDSGRREFLIRLKCTVTDQGRTVNLKSASWKVVHCCGRLRAAPASERAGTAGCLLLVCADVPLPLALGSQAGSFLTAHSLDMKITCCHRRVKELIGYEASQLVGRSVYHLVHALDLPHIWKRHHSLLKMGRVSSGLYRMLLCAGGYVWAQTEAAVVGTHTLHIVCVNHILSGPHQQGAVFSLEQLQRQSLPGARITGMRDPSRDWITGMRDPTGARITGARDPTGDWITGARDPTGDWITGARDPTGDWITGARDSTGDWITGVRDPTGDWIMGARDPTGDWITRARDPTGAQITGARDPAGHWITGASDPTGDWTNGVSIPTGPLLPGPPPHLCPGAVPPHVWGSTGMGRSNTVPLPAPLDPTAGPWAQGHQPDSPQTTELGLGVGPRRTPGPEPMSASAGGDLCPEPASADQDLDTLAPFIPMEDQDFQPDPIEGPRALGGRRPTGTGRQRASRLPLGGLWENSPHPGVKRDRWSGGSCHWASCRCDGRAGAQPTDLVPQKRQKVWGRCRPMNPWGSLTDTPNCPQGASPDHGVLPVLSSNDCEINAPVYGARLLAGAELLGVLDQATLE